MTLHRTLTLIAALFPLPALAQDGPGSHFVANWDLDGDGVVTVAEATERREMVFNMFDDDQNGMLDVAEYATFDDTRDADMQANGGGAGQGGHRAQEGLTLAFNDTNKDGNVALDEFLAQSADWIAQIDRDGDAVVTIADFGPRGN